MAARARLWTPAPRQPTFTTKSLWHLAAWGLAAGIALALAAAASYSDAGSRRLTVALGGSEGVVQEATPPASSRSQEPAIEIGPLIESVRSLAAERERLTARIENIERQLNDVTGSIKAPTGGSPPESMEPVGARPNSAPTLAQLPILKACANYGRRAKPGILRCLMGSMVSYRFGKISKRVLRSSGSLWDRLLMQMLQTGSAPR
jgi:hypothetical protein